MINREERAELEEAGPPRLGTEKQVATCDELVACGRGIWIASELCGVVGFEFVRTEMGAKALRVDTLIRAWGVTT